MQLFFYLTSNFSQIVRIFVRVYQSLTLYYHVLNQYQGIDGNLCVFEPISEHKRKYRMLNWQNQLISRNIVAHRGIWSFGDRQHLNFYKNLKFLYRLTGSLTEGETGYLEKIRKGDALNKGKRKEGSKDLNGLYLWMYG
jgi:hypothetical protein